MHHQMEVVAHHIFEDQAKDILAARASQAAYRHQDRLRAFHKKLLADRTLYVLARNQHPKIYYRTYYDPVVILWGLAQQILEKFNNF
jgi:hypothetical protein